MKGNYTNIISQVREKKPLVHHITNYVTVNDCANITLAIGASPIMADAIEEASAIASIANALVLNMGTLNQQTISAMISAGKAANEKKTPVIFDPVGAGASALRNETVATILNEVKITILRGNISEIRYIAGLEAQTKGVDAAEKDIGNISETTTIAKTLATKLKCIIAITGAIDIISDGNLTICVENGHPILSKITGSGCMCSSLIGSFSGAAPNMPLNATVAALLSMGIAGEIAWEKTKDMGNGSFRIALHDAISKINDEILVRRSKFREA